VEPVRVSVARPFLLAASLKGGQAFRWASLADGSFAGVASGRAWRLGEQDGALLVEAAPDVAPAEARAWAQRYFRLDDDYGAMGARLRRHEALRPAVEAWWGLRLLRTDPWECLLGFITSIHDSVAAIETRMGRLCTAYGEPVRAPWAPRGWTHAVPGPDRVAGAHEARLRSAAGMGFRARYLRAAARMVQDGDLPLAALASMPYDEAHEVLLRVPGVGDKVADCVQLYALGHMESFPVDRWIHRAMTQRYFAGDAKAKPRDMVALARATWGKDAGYAQQFLFHHDRLAGARRPSARAAVAVRATSSSR
jgi:N-glycosylase/DNA lyase